MHRLSHNISTTRENIKNLQFKSEKLPSNQMNKNWNYELFIDHFNDNFEDKMSARTAGEKLSRMRQRQHQSFATYLNDFEYILAQAKDLKWEGPVKVNALSGGLNDCLNDYLVSVRLPEDNYTQFVNEVKSVATKLEAKINYVPKRGIKHTETWFITRGRNIPHDYTNEDKTYHKISQDSTPTQLDEDGDTLMSGINGISISTLAAIINAVNLQG